VAWPASRYGRAEHLNQSTSAPPLWCVLSTIVQRHNQLHLATDCRSDCGRAHTGYSLLHYLRQTTPARAALAARFWSPSFISRKSSHISIRLPSGPGQRSRSTHHQYGEVHRQPRIHRSAVAASVHPRLVPNRPRSRDASIQGVELQGPIPPTEAKSFVIASSRAPSAKLKKHDSNPSRIYVVGPALAPSTPSRNACTEQDPWSK